MLLDEAMEFEGGFEGAVELFGGLRDAGGLLGSGLRLRL